MTMMNLLRTGIALFALLILGFSTAPPTQAQQGVFCGAGITCAPGELCVSNGYTLGHSCVKPGSRGNLESCSNRVAYLEARPNACNSSTVCSLANGIYICQVRAIAPVDRENCGAGVYCGVNETCITEGFKGFCIPNNSVSNGRNCVKALGYPQPNSKACQSGNCTCDSQECTCKSTNPDTAPPQSPVVIPTATPFPKPNPVTVNKPEFYCNQINSLKQFDLSWNQSSNALAYNVKVGSSYYAFDQTGSVISGTLEESKFPPNSQQTFTVEACNRGGCTPTSITVDIGASCGGSSTNGCPDNGANICTTASLCPASDRINGASGAAACSAAHIGVGSNAVCCKANSTNPPSNKEACGQNFCNQGEYCISDGTNDHKCVAAGSRSQYENCGKFEPGKGISPRPEVCNSSTFCREASGIYFCENKNNSTPPATPVPPNTGNESAATEQPCNPARGHLACISSSDVCEEGACGGAYFCVKSTGSANVKYCPGTGLIANNASCAICPSESAPSTPNPNLGASCGGSATCSSPLVCTNTYSLAGGKYCCPSGQIWCDRVTTNGTPINGCMSNGQCKDAAGGVVCEKANGHCYGDNSKCCSNNCVGTGATAYCK